MKVFITGATGFVGSWLLQQLLLDRRHEIAILVRDINKINRIAGDAHKIKIISGNINNFEYIEYELQEFQPHAIIHLAWEGVLSEERNNKSQWRNVQRSLELVEIAKRVGAKYWIGLGSQAEYGPSQNNIDESAPTNPTTLYGESKLATCNLTKSLCNEIGIRHAWIRLFSSYGPNDNPNWLIPYLINCFLIGNKPSLTSAAQFWDYIYIEDVATAIISILETDTAHGIFNLGSGNAQPLKKIIEIIRDSIDPQLPIGFGELPYRPDQVMYLQANIERLTLATGWKPRYDLTSGLKKTINWYLSPERRNELT